ncbi:MAG TPA: beta-propeller fold lactonase family protein [Gemmatimonadaceae bacterium]|nr:beta-propeller fold lactonase family protein [Gemmatimonadaceae bacterium]
MLISLVLLLQAGTPRPAPSSPQRPLPDPGVIATEQRVTPAGVQSVFRGKVGGVRFGRNPGEIWVAAPGAAYRLSWRDNRVVASSAFDGRAGVHGVVVDPATGRAIVSSVGRLPGNAAQSRTPGWEPLAANAAVAHVYAYAGDSTIKRAAAAEPDSAPIRVTSPALGDFMAGGPAVAARANGSGRRVMVLPLPANDALAVLDADDGSLLHTVPLGVLPVSAVVTADGATAFVSVLGGAKPKSGERAASQCCDPRAERVRVDARGIAARGNVTRVDLVSGRVTGTITVGLHPTGIALDEARARLYVVNGNSDDVSVIDTRTNAVVATIGADPFKQRRIGVAPTAVAISPDGGRLYVTLGGANAVAVYDVSVGSSARLRGLIPTSWYPSSIDVSADGRTLAVGSLLGMGSGTGTKGEQRGRYVHAVRGSVNVIEVPTDAELAAYTTSVAQNNRRLLASAPGAAPSLAPRSGVVPRPVPERPGEPTPIQHVVYIIRENRTYDQVLGDIGKGASDSSLVMYGADVTPNTHALANQFVLLDHFFASGGNSADGHNWLTQANETEYPMWPLYEGRSYPSEGVDPLAYSSGGFLWDGAQARGKTVSVFGEYAPSVQKPSSARRNALLAQYRDSQPHDPAFFRGLLKTFYNTQSEIRSLDRILVREYPGWTEEIPDVVKADVIIDHLREWEARKAMPNLVMVILPSDHTVGTSAGWCTPKACVADNDLALGRIVDALSHSSFWKSMAILSVEDDAQDGVDHIDGHRTVALVASPYARRGAIDSTFYAQPSMVKTIELMLGLPAMSAFDLVATDMRASFLGAGEQPDFTPYTAIVPTQSIHDVNQRVGEITGPHAAERRIAARASARMRFDLPDAAPSERLNRILWHDARGWRTPYPAVKQSLFFPLSISIADEDRDEVEEKGER